MNSRQVPSVVTCAALACITASVGGQGPDPFRQKASEDVVSPPTIDRSSTQFSTLSQDESVFSVYLLPMYGQMGTDIHSTFYEDLEEDILAHDPDLLVIVMNCSDQDDLMLPRNTGAEMGMFDPEEYRHIVDFFHDRDHLGNIPQVIWVQDSIGSSSLIAMSWSDLYMMPGGRLGGLQNIAAGTLDIADDDVRAKMIAAWTSIGKSFVEYGGYSLNLVDAMLMPKHKLSASFKGRTVDWKLDESGEFLVDANEKRTVSFRANAAEDLLISQGTAETLDDLLFLCGQREYRVVDGKAWPPGDDGISKGKVAKYVTKWRRTYDQTKEWWIDYQVAYGRASGKDRVKYLGRAKGWLTKVLQARNALPAVDTRWQHDMGMSKLRLEVLIEQLQEEITAARRAQRGAGGGGGGGVGGAGGR